MNKFGKYIKSVRTSQDFESLKFKVYNWSSENKLKHVRSTDEGELYRFGSPLLSNPIYIQVNLQGSEVLIKGWVQTLIPFLRWKLIPVEESGIGTTIDYRRKGGLFCNKLIKLLV